MIIPKPSEAYPFLSQHNLIKARFSLPHNDSSTLPEPPNSQKPLFITTIPFLKSRKKHSSFSNISDSIQKIQKAPNSTLKSFHHHILFENFRNSSEKQKKTPEKPNKKSFFINPKNRVSQLHLPISPKKMSVWDVLGMLDPMEKNSPSNSSILKNCLDPNLDLEKYSIRKADKNLIELTKGAKAGKNLTRLSIVPINEPEFLQAPISTFRSPFSQFLQKSLKGNRENIEKNNLQEEYNEVKEDVDEIRDKLYYKLNEKPKEQLKESSIFKFSKKTMIALGETKMNKMKEMYDQSKNPIDLKNYKEIGVPKLTYEELRMITKIYSHNKRDRDHYTLEQLTKNLKYFHQVSKDLRQFILRNSDLVNFPSNSIIIDEKNKGLHIYIILKGGVTIRGNFQKNSEKNNLVLTSLYDGDVFGDFSNEFGWNFTKRPKKGLLMIKEPYVQACESTDCLRMDFQIWNGVVIGMLQKEVNEKIRVLRGMELFKDEEKTTLMALASQFKIRSLKMGDVVVHAGEEVGSLFVIIRGSCAIIYREDDQKYFLGKSEEIQNFSIETPEDNNFFKEFEQEKEINQMKNNINVIMEQHKNDNLKQDKDNNIIDIPERKESIVKIISPDTSPAQNINNNDNFTKETTKKTSSKKNPPYSRKNRYQNTMFKPLFRHSVSLLSNPFGESYPKRIFPREGMKDVIGVLNELDFFCERALLLDSEIHQKSIHFGEYLNRTSKLTVVSDKEGTVLMELDRKDFLMLPIEIQARVRSLFKDTMEFDTVNREELGREMKNWELIRKEIRDNICKKT